jgi:hypothetical protein
MGPPALGLCNRGRSFTSAAGGDGLLEQAVAGVWPPRLPWGRWGLEKSCHSWSRSFNSCASSKAMPLWRAELRRAAAAGQQHTSDTGRHGYVFPPLRIAVLCH